MGMGGISVWQLLVILVIVLLLFGTKRLKSIGSDLGNAVKGFRSAMAEQPEREGTELKQLGEGGVTKCNAEGDKVASTAMADKDREKT